MTAYIIRRIIAAVPVLFFVALIAFLMFRLTPGDPAAVLAGENANLETIEQMRVNLGLHRPIHIQFALFIGRMFKGDFGESIFLNKPVFEAVIDRIEPTLSLAIASEIIALSFAIPIGVLAAWKANTLVDQGLMFFALLGISIPAFWLGLMLIFGIGVELKWLPVSDFRSLISDGPVDFFRHMIMPAFALGFLRMALVARLTRSSMLEVLREDYIRTAYAKGLAAKVVLMRHAMRNALIPTVTIWGLGMAGVLSGAVVIETVFTIPGLGRLIAAALINQDYPLIQAVLMLVAGLFIIFNLVVDILYAYMDPRIRY